MEKDGIKHNTTIVGQVNRIIFQDQERGRAILSVVRDNDKSCCLLADIRNVEIGSVLEATGRWEKNEKYGWRFVAESVHDLSPCEETHEPVEDGLIHALDFSNVLNKRTKDFRNVDLEHVYDDVECSRDSIKRPSQRTKEEEVGGLNKKVGSQQDGRLVVKDGIVYNKDLTKLICGPKARPSISIPNSVTSICFGSFSDSILESVQIPESVESIRGEAFSNCKKLTSVTIPGSVKQIGNHVFTGCENLTSINVDKSNDIYCDLDGILYSHDLSQLLYVPNGLVTVTISELTKSIKPGAFMGCNKLTCLSLPPSISDMAPGEFYSCPKLTSIIVSDNIICEGIANYFNAEALVKIGFADSVTHITYGMLKGCDSLVSIEIPACVQEIDDRAFSGCQSLKTIVLAEGNTHFKVIDDVLYDYDVTRIISVPQGKTSVSIPDTITSISDRVFYSCKQLQSIIIPESVTSIGNEAFCNCISLTNITIPASVTSIGERAFALCTKLVVNFSSLTIRVDKDAFLGCENILADETVNIEWSDVTFLKGIIRIDSPFFGRKEIIDENVNESVNSMRRYLAKMIPCLIVHFDSNGTPAIVNLKELHDAVIILRIKCDLSSLIRSGYSTSEILKRIDGLPQKQLREFLPRDKSPYISFLLTKHTADKYPLVPIVEYIGGSSENGALYTIMIEGEPNIVWENNNDARSTYVFRCTEEDYVETRQLVFDYIMAEENGKRKLLHMDRCLKVFKEKPRMVVHNNLTSWARRLMCDPELVFEIAEKPNIKENPEEELFGEIDG